MKLLKALGLILFLFLFFLPLSSSKASPPSQANKISPKIVNGQKPANMKDWGWIVHLRDSGSSCTGVLIDRYWVLTAAHCVNDDQGRIRNPGGFLVSIGKFDTQASKEVFRVADIFSHGFYQKSSEGYSYHDIALMQLDRPANNKPLARLPLNNDNDGPGVGRIAGYGKFCGEQKPECNNARFLLEGTTRVRSTEFCDDEFDVSQDRQIICTTPMSPIYAQICYGDSGGPLVVDKGRGPVVIGVLSMFNAPRVGACNSNNVNGYTSTAKYIKWISHFVNRDLSVKSSKVQVGGIEDVKKRTATVTIKNTSTKWHLSIKDIQINSAGRYCASKPWARSIARELDPCGITSSFANIESLYYNSKYDKYLSNKMLFRVIQNNCPVFKPGSRSSSEYFMSFIALNRTAMLKPKKSCQLKIQIKSPDRFLLNKKSDKKQVTFSGFYPTPGAQFLQVSVTSYPNPLFKDTALIQSCVDSTSKKNKNLWYSNCKNDIKALRKDPAGQYFSRNCRSVFQGSSTTSSWVPSAQCGNLWKKARNKYS